MDVYSHTPILLTGLLAVGASAQPATTSCGDCHLDQATSMSQSVHRAAGVECRTCHGGSEFYSAATQPATGDPAQSFDHGAQFKGKPTRLEIPEACGTCHSNVSKMNPYGLPTDQLAQYRTSGHGQALFEEKNEKVAVCTDCHGTHAVMDPKAAGSPVYPTNVPATCGHCHGDKGIMAGSNLSTTVIEEYKQSVHGLALLERGDTGAPHCAVCHGSHSAIPPGYSDVGHICGRCHQQEESHFLNSHHAKFPMFPRCVGCHTASPDRRDHLIRYVIASPDSLRKTYNEVRALLPDASIEDEAFLDAFAERREPRLQVLGDYCNRCHSVDSQVAHRAFLQDTDRMVMEMAEQLFEEIRLAEIRYAAAAERVDQTAAGVLLVDEEAMMAEDMRTKMVSLGPLLHELRPMRLAESAGELENMADELHGSLDTKINGLEWRHWTLIPMWAFIVVFSSALWVKYKRLKAEMVKPLPR
jgi:hypothetical protein